MSLVVVERPPYLWSPDYTQPDPIAAGWRSVQQAEPGRITVTDGLLRVELRQGDVTNTGGYLANRSEVYGRAPQYMSSAPAANWPDPVGSERWYGFSVLVPEDFAMDTNKWFTLTQWKGYKGGSPPEALEIDGGYFELGGTKGRRDLGGIGRGQWTRFEFGFRWANDTTGWVEVWRNGANVLPRQQRVTMDTINGKPDPIYLKQGIYRTSAWAATHVLLFSPTKVGATRASVN